MFNFGSIFRYKEYYYVYLVQRGEFTFAARIVDPEKTRELSKMRDLKSKNPKNRTTEQPLYCFTILTTDEFRDSSAHYGRPEISTDGGFELISQLNEEDIEKLKQDIKSDGAISPLLKEAISEIFPN